jgi:hypothetical protein
MEYTNIDRSQQAQVLRSRLQQWEAEHLNHATNISVLKATGVDSEQRRAQIKQSEDAMKVLDAAHAEVMSQLSKIEAETPTAPTAPATPAPKKAAKRR